MNMSYCKFENTLRDFDDCVSTMQFAEDFSDMKLNGYEVVALHNLAEAAETFLTEYRRITENEANKELEQSRRDEKRGLYGETV